MFSRPFASCSPSMSHGPRIPCHSGSRERGSLCRSSSGNGRRPPSGAPGARKTSKASDYPVSGCASRASTFRRRFFGGGLGDARAGQPLIVTISAARASPGFAAATPSTAVAARLTVIKAVVESPRITPPRYPSPVLSARSTYGTDETFSVESSPICLWIL
jgi:hypothetical protein